MSLNEITSMSTLSEITAEIERLEGLSRPNVGERAQLAYLKEIAERRDGQETPFLDRPPAPR